MNSDVCGWKFEMGGGSSNSGLYFSMSDNRLTIRSNFTIIIASVYLVLTNCTVVYKNDTTHLLQKDLPNLWCVSAENYLPSLFYFSFGLFSRKYKIIVACILQTQQLY